MQVDYETTLGTTVIENIVIKNGRKHSGNKVSYNYLGPQLKQITIQEDHNIQTYSLVCLVVLHCIKNEVFIKDFFSKCDQTAVSCGFGHIY